MVIEKPSCPTGRFLFLPFTWDFDVTGGYVDESLGATAHGLQEVSEVQTTEQQEATQAPGSDEAEVVEAEAEVAVEDEVVPEAVTEDEARLGALSTI